MDSQTKDQRGRRGMETVSVAANDLRSRGDIRTAQIDRTQMTPDLESRFYRELARLLVAKRKLRGITQQDLARRAGVHRNTLARWEDGLGHIPLYMLLRIADILSCNHLALLPGREYVWPGARVEEFNPFPPKPPEPARPIQFERDAPLAKRERTS